MSNAQHAHIHIARQKKLSAAMADHNLDALALNPGPTLTYMTGLDFHLMERPLIAFFAPGRTPVAVIPAIGEHLMSQTWIDDIRTWASPDYTDDGVGLLANTLVELAGKGSKIGVPSGPETHLRMPQADSEGPRRAPQDMWSGGRTFNQSRSEDEVAQSRGVYRIRYRPDCALRWLYIYG